MNEKEQASNRSPSSKESEIINRLHSSKESKIINRSPFWKESRITNEFSSWKYTLMPQCLHRKKELEELIARKEGSTVDVPAGTLRISQNRRTYQFYLRSNPGDTEGKYIRRDNIELARRIAQRDYDIQIKKLAEKELILLDRYIDFLREKDIDEIYDKLHPARQAMINPIRVPDEEFINHWRNESYSPLEAYEMPNSYCSYNGIYVRSKSELLIANMLEHYKIPYRDEYPIMVNGHSYRPDFMCLNVKKRKEYLWEHFGKMGDPDYANKTVSKINEYEQNGYTSGVNFIMTFESYEHPLESNIVAKEILTYLL